MSASAEQREHAVERAGKIFALLRQAAERGESCPTNATLAERFGVRPNSISRSFEFLEANGMIRVERGNDCRVVQIVSSGLETARPHKLRRAA